MLATDGAAYLRERILTPRIGLLWLLLVLAGIWAAPRDTDRLPLIAAGMALLLPAFRLWDDLADVGLDRRNHPQRILPRTRSLAGFRRLRWLLLALSAGLVLAVSGVGALAGLVVLVAAFLVLYRLTPGDTPLRAACVLAKYPAFVLLLTPGPRTWTTWAAALAVYALPLLDELRSQGRAILAPAALVLGLLAAAGWTLLH